MLPMLTNYSEVISQYSKYKEMHRTHSSQGEIRRRDTFEPPRTVYLRWTHKNRRLPTRMLQENGAMSSRLQGLHSKTIIFSETRYKNFICQFNIRKSQLSQTQMQR
jgi:hypothetical protein